MLFIARTLDKIFAASIKNHGSAHNPQVTEFRGFRKWFNSIFNSVDEERLKLNGPDVTCAEWLLRNGAAVRFKGQPSLITDYNVLIELEDAGKTVNSLVEEIYAKNVSLNSQGFDHLIGCNHIKKITFILCNQIDFYCLHKLNYVKDSLEYLEIRSCINVTDKGLLSLRDLSNLKMLILEDLPHIKNNTEVESALKSALNNCQVNYKH